MRNVFVAALVLVVTAHSVCFAAKRHDEVRSIDDATLTVVNGALQIKLANANTWSAAQTFALVENAVGVKLDDPTDATSGDVARNSPLLRFESTWWNGGGVDQSYWDLQSAMDDDGNEWFVLMHNEGTAVRIGPAGSQSFIGTKLAINYGGTTDFPLQVHEPTAYTNTVETIAAFSHTTTGDPEVEFGAIIRLLADSDTVSNTYQGGLFSRWLNDPTDITNTDSYVTIDAVKNGGGLGVAYFNPEGSEVDTLTDYNDDLVLFTFAAAPYDQSDVAAGYGFRLSILVQSDTSLPNIGQMDWRWLNDPVNAAAEDAAFRLYVTQDGTPVEVLTALGSGLVSMTASGSKLYVGTATAPPSPSFPVLYATAAAYPVAYFEQTSSVTNTTKTALLVSHKTSGDMADDFASAIEMAIEDAGSGGKVSIAGIVAKRAGADNSGGLFLDTYYLGTLVQNLRLHPGSSPGNGTEKAWIDGDGDMQLDGNFTAYGTGTSYVMGNFGAGVSPVTRLHVSGATVEARVVDTSATGDPKISLYQTTSERGYLQYQDTGDILRLDSDGAMVFAQNNTAHIYIDSAGAVAFNDTNSATADLTIHGDVNDNLLFADVGLETVGLGVVAEARRKLKIYQTFDAANADVWRGLSLQNLDQSTTANTHYAQALYVEADISSTVSSALTGYNRAIQVQALHKGSGTAAETRGVFIDVGTNSGTSGGAITASYGVTVNVPAIAASTTLTTFYGFQTAYGTPGANAVWTTGYGLYLGTLPSIVTNKWGVYQTGASDTNYLAAPLWIGTSSGSSKALLDLTSTTQGFLPPRMTTANRDNITAPPAGLVIYNTSTNKLNMYNGSVWEAVTSS